MKTKTPLHTGHRDRVKTRYAREGLMSFAEHEVLELVLYPFIPQVDVNPIAHSLLHTYGSLRGVFTADPTELIKTFGMTRAAAEGLHAYLGYMAFYEQRKGVATPYVGTLNSCFRFAKSVLNEYENGYAILCMDARHNLLSYFVSERYSEALKEFPDYLSRMIALNPAGVLLAHTTANAETRDYDRQLTTAYMLALNALSVNFLDHIAICGDGFVSYDRLNILSDIRKEAEYTELSRIAESAINDKLD